MAGEWNLRLEMERWKESLGHIQAADCAVRHFQAAGYTPLHVQLCYLFRPTGTSIYMYIVEEKHT